MASHQDKPSSSNASEPAERAPDGNALVRFGRKHPGWTIAGLAGAGLIGGVELAAGVLLGAGFAALLRRERPEAPGEQKGRMREAVERVPHDLHELKERARAVMAAALGEKAAPPKQEREESARAPSHG